MQLSAPNSMDFERVWSETSTGTKLKLGVVFKVNTKAYKCLNLLLEKRTKDNVKYCVFTWG